MSTSVRLQIDGVDLTSEATLEAIATSGLVSAQWAEIGGVQIATLHLDSTNFPSEVLQFARLLACRVPGARVVRVHRDLVSASDIAHRTGFSRETVRKWASGMCERSFPAPYGSVGDDSRTSKIWLWSEVVLWLVENYGISLDVDWPDESTIAHIEACLQKVPDYATQEWRTITVSTPLEAPVERQLPARKVQVPSSRMVHGESVVAWATSVQGEAISA